MSVVTEWIYELKQLDLEQLQRTLESYSQWGPLPGLLASVAEALLPFLPLMVIIAANANIYGLWYGILLSWAGVSIGCILVFLLARKLGGRFGGWLQRKYPATAKFFNWIERRGFTPIFLLACFPFSPSSLINIASGLSRVPFRTFVLAVVLGKAVMIFCISMISFDITHLAQEPMRIVIAIAAIVLLWLGGKRLEARFQ